MCARRCRASTTSAAREPEHPGLERQPARRPLADAAPHPAQEPPAQRQRRGGAEARGPLVGLRRPPRERRQRRRSDDALAGAGTDPLTPMRPAPAGRPSFQSAKIFPGFMMFFGSSARLIGAHQIDRVGTGFVDQEVHLVQPDAMLAAAGAVHVEGALDELPGSAFRPARARPGSPDRSDRRGGSCRRRRGRRCSAAGPRLRPLRTALVTDSARREIGTQVSVVTVRQPGLICRPAK